MPELPEVETVVRSLQPLLPGACIVGIDSVWPRAIADLQKKREMLIGQRIVAVARRAKYLILHLERGALVIHLRMTGKLYPSPSPAANRKHLSAALALDDGRFLIFEDQRRFGRIYFDLDPQALARRFARIGPEPLDAGFTAESLRQMLHGRRRQIKALLLDQSFVAGLGNIYVDESLWYAGIHPLTIAGDIPAAKVRRLHRGIRLCLRRSIAANGATLRDFRFLGGEKGGYTERMLVFRRQGQPCRRCRATIQKQRLAGRGTHFCPRCQRAPRQGH